jgi:hypothetical protein
MNRKFSLNGLMKIWVFIIPVAITFGINLALEAPTLWTKNIAWHSNWFD